ncbi:MAG TPA: helix-turn-helix domain-containing protein, partial [Dermatophilaceae bacterium]|nr:helix-turn-helix domain-containing protein [Dermatophilaceae bacterium]
MLERSPEEEPAAVRVMRRARRLAERSAQRRANALAAHGIDQGQLDVLEALVAVGQPFRLTAGELTRACGVTPGATSQRLTVMERSGLVERVREEPDRRTVHVQ